MFVFEVRVDFSGCEGWSSMWCALWHWSRLFVSLNGILEVGMCNAMVFYAGLLNAHGLAYAIMVFSNSSGAACVPSWVHSGWHTIDCRRVSCYGSGPGKDNVARSSGRGKRSNGVLRRSMVSVRT